MHILIACDSFKGSLSATDACRIVAGAMGRARPDWTIEQQPLADGGEGTADVLMTAEQGRWVEVPRVMGPLPSMLLTAAYAWLPGSATAVVEMARASGLMLLSDARRDPLRATTFGTGQLLAAARSSGARQVLLTLGGSATVDGGTGAARALGWRFLDAQGREVPLGGGGLSLIRHIEPPAEPFAGLSAWCDVTTPLCGPRGAAPLFAPQKGATPRQVDRLAAGLEHLAEMVERQLGIKVGDLPGGGAAGGFGAGAVAFLRGRLEAGSAAVLARVRFEEQLRRADWVITGEGQLDQTSLQGKVISGVLETARRLQVPVAVLAGQVGLSREACRRAGIRVALPAMPAAMPLAEGLARAPQLLATAAARLAAHLDGCV